MRSTLVWKFVFAALLGFVAAGAGCTCAGPAGAVCGNGALEAPEECDDNNTTAGDGCSATCTTEVPTTCGDGAIDPGEQCDDANTTSGDGCSATCMLEGNPNCGNGTLDAGEDCEGGALGGETCVTQGFTGGTLACTTACTFDTTGCTGGGAVCGNNTVELGEQCDDGNTTSGDGCSATCMNEGTAGLCGPEFPAGCGDSIGDDVTVTGVAVNDWMACLGFPDAGPEIAYVFTPTTTGDVTLDLTVTVADMDILVVQGDATGACDPTDCALLVDASVNGGTGAEQVTFTAAAGTTYYVIIDTYTEGGETGGPFTLDVTCAPPPVCGDGNVDPGEECDDGNTTPGDGCDDACMNEPAVCGDGILQFGEQCDDGNTTPGDGCDDFCMYEGVGACGPEAPAICADSISDDITVIGLPINDWMTCFGFADAGPEYAFVFVPTYTGDVTVDLTVTDPDMDLIVVQGDAAGACDPTDCANIVDASLNGGTTAETVTFTATLGTTYYLIVDTYLPGGTGGAFTLDVTCAPPPVCGNGVLEAGEECDDGNTTAGDGCDDLCALEPSTCGDGFIAPDEQCDDANMVAGDGCDNCVLECGPQPSTVLSCGGTVMDDTSTGGVSVNDMYSCGGFTEAGNEIVFTFTATATELVTFNVSGIAGTVDLDLFLIGNGSQSCTECVAASEAGAGANESVSIAAVAGETYQIVVDTFSMTGGAFTLDTVCGNTACLEDSTETLSGATPLMFTVDNTATSDDVPPPSCGACGAGGDDQVVAVTIPAGFTGLDVVFDQGMGDQFIAVFSGDGVCSELGCYDWFATGTTATTFTGLTSGAADEVVYLLVDSCGAGNGSLTDFTLTALP